MRPSRGMGAVKPSKLGRKMPKKITRTDDPDTVDMYKKGGSVGRKRLKTIDKDVKQDKNARAIGRRKKAAENFGNLSKYYKGN